MNTLICGKHLAKSYGPPLENTQNASLADYRPVLDQVDIELSANEFVTIVGRSGSGKSTLLNILGAMDNVDSGELLFNGADICRWNEEQRARYRREKIGFIFQAYNLVPTLTVIENLMMPLQLAGSGNSALVCDYLEQLEMSDKRDHWPDQLSGGEQQRIAIIRALIHQPQLVIADEPTGNLDRDNADKVIHLLCDLVRAQGISLVLATHDRSICAEADRVLEIESGKLRNA
ncbi:MAG: ABC transporter ATP-binding protein [Pseudomonadota bacterium]